MIELKRLSELAIHLLLFLYSLSSLLFPLLLFPILEHFLLHLLSLCCFFFLMFLIGFLDLLLLLENLQLRLLPGLPRLLPFPSLLILRKPRFLFLLLLLLELPLMRDHVPLLLSGFLTELLFSLLPDFTSSLLLVLLQLYLLPLSLRNVTSGGRGRMVELTLRRSSRSSFRFSCSFSMHATMIYSICRFKLPMSNREQSVKHL